MVRRLETTPGFNTYACVILDLSSVPTIDGTAALAIEDMLTLIQSHHQHLFFVGMKPAVAEVLDGLGVLPRVRPKHRYAPQAGCSQTRGLIWQAHLILLISLPTLAMRVRRSLPTST